MTKEEWKEHIERIKQLVKIIEYAEYLGYHVKRKGNGIYYTLEEHDSVIINSVTNRFFRNAALQEPYARGSVINFAMYFGNNEMGMEYKEAIQDLENFIGIDNINNTRLKLPPCPKKKEKQMLLLPSHGGSRKHAYAYLNKSRCIDKFVIDYFFASNHLYEDDRNNCVFVSYDEDTHKPDFACLRGTLTNNSFKPDVKGSSYKYCYRLPASGGSILYVTEAVIDLMSLMTYFLNQGIEKKIIASYHYQAVASTQKYMAIFNYLELHPEIETVYLAFDNDEAGIKACEKVIGVSQEKNCKQTMIAFLPPEKNMDWNDAVRMDVN